MENWSSNVDELMIEKNLEGSGELDIRETILHMKHNDFIILGAEDFGEIERKINTLSRLVKVLAIGLLVSLGLTFVSLYMVEYIRVSIGFAMFAVSCYLMILRERWIIEDLQTISGSTDEGEGLFDIYIFSKSEALFGKAKRLLQKAINKNIESQEILIMFSPKILLIDFLVDISYMVGLLLLMSIYMYASIIFFLIFGFCILYIILDVSGKVLDLAATLD